MDTVKIIMALVEELKKTYTNVSDFEEWVPVRASLEAERDNMLYLLEYTIVGHREVETELTVMKYIVKNGKFQNTRIKMDKYVKQCIESFMTQVFGIWYDCLEEDERQQADDEEAMKEERDAIFETERSLYISER